MNNLQNTTSSASVATTTQRERAVVVGSGFGGGVTALRLAQAGVSTLVLERGLRWPTGPNSATFCRFANMDNRSAWLSGHSVIAGVDKMWTPFTGVLEAVEGNGMTLQPTKAHFAASMPMAASTTS